MHCVSSEKKNGSIRMQWQMQTKSNPRSYTNGFTLNTFIWRLHLDFMVCLRVCNGFFLWRRLPFVCIGHRTWSAAVCDDVLLVSPHDTSRGARFACLGSPYVMPSLNFIGCMNVIIGAIIVGFCVCFFSLRRAPNMNIYLDRVLPLFPSFNEHAINISAEKSEG